MNSLARLETELRNDPASVDAILSHPNTFAPVPPEPNPVLIRCDEVSISLAIARAATLAINGTESRIELVNP